jgi:hypothetical protein
MWFSDSYQTFAAHVRVERDLFCRGGDVLDQIEH